MNRGVWFGAGVAAGVYAVVRARRVAEVFTVDGMRDRVGAVFVGARLLAQEVEQGRVDAEAELRERYRRAVADQSDTRALPAADPDAAPSLHGPHHESTPAPEKGTH